MRPRYTLLIVIGLFLQLFPIARPAAADKVQLSDGRAVDGIVKKIEKGQVTIDVGGEPQTFDVLQISGIDFDTPRLTEGTPRLPVEHFLGDMETQEMVKHVKGVEDAAASIRSLIDQTKKEWANQRSISPEDTVKWTNAKENLYAPLSRYQESLNDLYFHVLGKVDEYNELMKEADSVYVGVKGWFNVGSSLVPSGMEKLPLKKYVPGEWYDTIFFEGYDRGYSEAAEKYRKDWTSNSQ